MVSEVLHNQIKQLPNEPGVYWMKDRFGHVLYVGKAKNLKKRATTYFQPSRKRMIAQPKVVAMLEMVYELDWRVVQNEAEALLLEGRLIKQWKPKYNTDFTDDKQFLLIRIDPKEPLPQLRLVRNQLDDGATYFGPFAKSGSLRTTLKDLRKRFGILLGDAHPKKLPDGKYQLYDDARSELFGHPNTVTQEAYYQQLQAACNALEGTTKAYMEELSSQMQAAAKSHLYEKAAELRDRLFALKETLRPTRRFLREPVFLKNKQNTTVLADLQKALRLTTPPKVIEGFDISHISGTFTVASMVCFENGIPKKQSYRHFKIQSHTTNNDFRSMIEVVGRRYRRLSEEKKLFPDLILIDGGLPQVNAALTAFELEGLTPPPLIGLAKKEEIIIFPDGTSLQLERHSLALRLLQQVRDEAHRFANSYNKKLRSKKIKESILDTIPGLGPKKRTALLSTFKTLEAVKKASTEELSAAPGIGPSLAAAIYNTLQGKSL